MEIKLIPETKNFSISKDGRVFNSAMKEMKQYKNGDGYKTVAVVKNSGKWQTYGLHRLLAITFIPIYVKLEKLSVNHIDSNKLNNTLSNLEWVSVGDNNIHSALLRGSKQRPVILAKDKTGNFEFIDNIYVAAKRFNCDIDLIWSSIKNQSLLNGYVLYYHKSKQSKPTNLHISNFKSNRLGAIKPVKIKVLNIETNEVQTFCSMWEAASVFNVTSTHIFNLLSSIDKTRLFKKKYIIVRDGQDFPTITQEEYETLLRPHGKSVIAYNVTKKMYYIYESAAKLIRDNVLSKKSITTNLRKNIIRAKSGWICLYYNEENIKRLRAVIGSPVSITNQSTQIDR